MKRFFITLLLVAIAIVFAASGCQDDPDDSDGSTPGSNSSGPEKNSTGIADPSFGQNPDDSGGTGAPGDPILVHRPWKAEQCEYDFSGLTAILQGFEAQGISLGMAIVNRRKVVYKKFFGDWTDETIAPLASASKMPAVTAFLTLVDQGLVDLEDPVNLYLDYWPADKAEITLRMLLAHTAGLRQEPFCTFLPNMTLDQCVREIAAKSLLANPGTAFMYGAAGPHVAGRIAEVVSGQSWAQFFQERIAEPCHMDTFTFGETENPRIGGGAFSDISDYANILRTQLAEGMFNETTVLSKVRAREMRTDQLYGLGVPFTLRYGMGWWIFPAETFETRHMFHSAGGYGTIPWIDTKYEYAAVVMMDETLNAGWNVYWAVLDVVQEQFENCH